MVSWKRNKCINHHGKHNETAKTCCLKGWLKINPSDTLFSRNSKDKVLERGWKQSDGPKESGKWTQQKELGGVNLRSSTI